MNTTVIIRVATGADEPRCMELFAALQAATGNAFTEQGKSEVFSQLLDGVRGEILVAQEADTLLGVATVSYNLATRYGGEYCQLEELVVDPAARGKNIGGQLVAETVTRARRRGCADYGLYLVDSTEHNRGFYEKYGFTAVGTEMRQKL